MPNHQCSIHSYPLLPYSQLVYDSTRFMPGLYWLGCTVRVHGGAKHENEWREAIYTALKNHPVFSARVNWRGQQYASSCREMLHGRYHHFSLRIDGEHLLITGRMSRILGDGKSVAVLLDDIRRAYRGETLKKDDYWAYLDYVEQQKQTDRYRVSRDWLVSEYADETIPVRPTIDRCCVRTLLLPKVGIFSSDYTGWHERIVRFAEAAYLSMDGFFSLCTALAIAEYCGTDAAALTWAYEGRERPEEQRVYGSLHRDIPFQIKVTDSKSDLIKEARNQIRSGIAHSNYPYTLTKPYTERWNYAVNVLRIESETELIKLLPGRVELVPSPAQKYAYALLDVEIHESSQLTLVYRYSATHYKESSIKKFAVLVRKYAEWLLEE